MAERQVAWPGFGNWWTSPRSEPVDFWIEQSQGHDQSATFGDWVGMGKKKPQTVNLNWNGGCYPKLPAPHPKFQNIFKPTPLPTDRIYNGSHALPTDFVKALRHAGCGPLQVAWPNNLECRGIEMHMAELHGKLLHNVERMEGNLTSLLIICYLTFVHFL